MRSLIGEYRTVANKEIACGFPSGTAEVYPDGESVAGVAAQHVFGVGVPQRDFMAYSREDVERKSAPLLKKIVQLVNKGQSRGVPELMEAAGIAGAKAIKLGILDGTYEPNSPATLHPSVGGTNPDGKKSTKPLIDTGHMIQSVTHVVREKS